MDRQGQNVILIGMPGAGKSTLGVLFAKALGLTFLDTDVQIQALEGRLLHELVDALGNAGFCALEERHLQALDCSSTVVATGGSAVYSAAAMAHLRSTGPTIWLDLSLKALQERLDNLETRGVVFAPGETLADLYARRTPLYQRYADITVRCDDRDHDEIVAQMVARLEEFSPV